MDAVVELGGAQHTLRFTLRALKLLEEKSGQKITDPGFTDWAGSIEGLGILLWACLVHESDPMSLEELENLIGVEDIPKIAEVLQGGFISSLPNVGAGTQKATSQTTPRSTGTRSKR